MKDIKYSKCAKKWHRIQVLNSSWFRVIYVMLGWIVGMGLITYGAILMDKCLYLEGMLIVFLGMAIPITAHLVLLVLNEEQYQSLKNYQEYTSKREYERREKENKKWLM